MIRERAPAYILSTMVLIILAQRLAILNTADAGIFLLTAAGLVVNLVTQAAGQSAPPPAQLPPAPEPPQPAPRPAAPLPDLRDDPGA